jgi:peptidoglycan/xylan/chitin deacetylase (PgdA/CDA1 family)
MAITLKKTLLKSLYNLGVFAPFHWASRDKTLILMYHRFSYREDPYKISSAEFLSHLEYLKKNSCVLSLAEAVESLRDKKPVPPNTTVITIDDGYGDAYEIAFPLLKKFGFPATLFAISDFLDGKCWLWTDLMRYVLLSTTSESLKIEFENGDKIEAKLTSELQRLELANQINSWLKGLLNEQKDSKIKGIAASLRVEIPTIPTLNYTPITWQQAREMDAGNLKIESHTVTHPILTNVNQTELDFELQTSKKRLQNVLDKEIEHFCYPNGTLNELVQKSVEQAGYKSAVTTVYGFNERQANQFLLNRIGAPPAIENFAQSASGFEATKQKMCSQIA